MTRIRPTVGELCAVDLIVKKYPAARDDSISSSESAGNGVAGTFIKREINLLSLVELKSYEFSTIVKYAVCASTFQLLSLFRYKKVAYTFVATYL